MSEVEQERSAAREEIATLIYGSSRGRFTNYDEVKSAIATFASNGPWLRSNPLLHKALSARQPLAWPAN